MKLGLPTTTLRTLERAPGCAGLSMEMRDKLPRSHDPDEPIDFCKILNLAGAEGAIAYLALVGQLSVIRKFARRCATRAIESSQRCVNAAAAAATYAIMSCEKDTPSYVAHCAGEAMWTLADNIPAAAEERQWQKDTLLKLVVEERRK